MKKRFDVSFQAIERIEKKAGRFPTIPLNKLVRTYSGGTPSKSNPEFWDGAIPWVSPKDFGKHNLSDSEDHISEKGRVAAGLNLIPERSVLMVVRSGILKHSLPVALTTTPVTINQDLKAFVTDEAILPEYLADYFVVFGSALLPTIVKHSTTVQSLNTPQLESLQIPLPPLEIQRALVDELESARTRRREQLAQADALIDGLDAWLLEQLGLQTPQVEKRVSFGVKLKDIRHKRLDVTFQWDERGGPTTSKFVMTPLGELVDFTSGGTPSKARPDFWKGTIPWVSPKDFGPHILADSEDHISEAGLRAAGLQLLPANTVLIVVRSGVLKHTLPVTLTSCPVAINQDLKALQIRPNANLSADYLATYLSVDGQRLLPSIMKHSTTVQSLNTPQLEELKIPLPPLEIQNAIAAEVRRRRDAATGLRNEAQTQWDAAKTRFEAQLLGEKL